METMFEGSADMMAAGEAALRQIGAFVAEFSLSLLGAIVLVIVGYAVAARLERWTYDALMRVRGLDETLRRFFSKLVRYAVLLVVAISVLGQFGVQTTSIIAALGAAGLAIGLALQGTLQNIAAGIMLLVLRPFRAGEYVQVGALAGTVQEIGLFATQLKTYDGLFVMAPNVELWNAPVTNFSRNPARLQDITLRIAQNEDVERALQVLAELAAADSRVLDDPASSSFVAALEDGAIVITLRYWTLTGDWWQTKNALTKAAKQTLDDNGIAIAVPVRDIHVAGGQASGGDA